MPSDSIVATSFTVRAPLTRVTPVSVHDSWARYTRAGETYSGFMLSKNSFSKFSTGASKWNASTSGADRRVLPRGQIWLTRMPSRFPSRAIARVKAKTPPFAPQ